ncbi:MAG: HPr-rel-A system PqqD family peptide chaperone [Actinomycetota bacterium]
MKPKVRDDLTVVELDGEGVIYDEASGELHHLNETATLVFSLLDGTGTVKEIAVDLSGAFGQDAKTIEDQLRPLIRGFKQAGLLEQAS